MNGLACNTQFDAEFIDERSEETSTPASGRGLVVGGHGKGLTFMMRGDVSRIMKVSSGRQLAVNLRHLEWQLFCVVEYRVAGRADHVAQVVRAVPVDGDAIAADALFARFL